jgi:Phosphate-induced protein 1 conserved region
LSFVISFRTLKILSAIAVFVLTGVSGVAQVARGRSAQELNQFDQHDQAPNGKGWGAAHDHELDPELFTPDATRSDGMEPRGDVATAAGAGTQPQITYHGGPVMLGTTNVYVIWYGDWSTDRAAQNLLPEFLSSVGGTRWYNINTTYKNKAGQRVSNSVHYAGHATNGSSYKTLVDADVRKIVVNAINNGSLPKDSHAVYFVLTAPGVKEMSGFCTQYCGWHTHTTLSGTDIKYAFVGNPKNQCASACEEQTTRSPNADPAADGMASVIAHELSEAVTDPDLNAWFDSSGDENADKCAWTFGTTFAATNGAKANVQVGTREWLIQQNWVNATKGYCAKAY